MVTAIRVSRNERARIGDNSAGRMAILGANTDPLDFCPLLGPLNETCVRVRFNVLDRIDLHSRRPRFGSIAELCDVPVCVLWVRRSRHDRRSCGRSGSRFPPPRRRGRLPGMALSIIGIAFAAFCIWLKVRIVNRRERWAKWTLATMVAVLPLLYIFSFGLAVRNAAVPLLQYRNGTVAIVCVPRAFWPIGWLSGPGESGMKIFSWYMRVWMPDSTVASGPMNRDGSRYWTFTN